MRILSNIGGADVAEAIKLMMKAIGSAKLWHNFNYDGQKDKLSIKTTGLPELLQSKFILLNDKRDRSLFIMGGDGGGWRCCTDAKVATPIGELPKMSAPSKSTSSNP